MTGKYAIPHVIFVTLPHSETSLCCRVAENGFSQYSSWVLYGSKCVFWYRTCMSIDLFWSDCVKALCRISKFIYILLTLANSMKTSPFIELSVTYGQITTFYTTIHRNTYTYQKYIFWMMHTSLEIVIELYCYRYSKITPCFEFWTIQVWIFVLKFYYADWNLKCF